MSINDKTKEFMMYSEKNDTENMEGMLNSLSKGEIFQLRAALNQHLNIEDRMTVTVAFISLILSIFSVLDINLTGVVSLICLCFIIIAVAFLIISIILKGPKHKKALSYLESYLQYGNLKNNI